MTNSDTHANSDSPNDLSNSDELLNINKNSGKPDNAQVEGSNTIQMPQSQSSQSSENGLEPTSSESSQKTRILIILKSWIQGEHQKKMWTLLSMVHNTKRGGACACLWIFEIFFLLKNILVAEIVCFK